MPVLKVGTGVDIVFEKEINKRNAHYMKALVYDYKSGNVIISQQCPVRNLRDMRIRILNNNKRHLERNIFRKTQ